MIQRSKRRARSEKKAGAEKVGARATRITAAELPCERASRVIIPSIRAALVRHLVEEKKLSRYGVAKLLGITPASVTNYMKGERGDPELEKKILSEEEYSRIIEAMADLILSSRGLSNPEAYVKFKELVCTICSGLNEAAQRAGCGSKKEEVPTP